MVTTFADLGVPAPVVAELAARGINAPFAIQAASVQHGLDRRDVCGRAPTGSGKTIAFGIPLVVDLPRAKPKRPRALVLAPTRELAEQISDELTQLGKPLRVTVTAIYGGVGYGPQRSALRRGTDIVVACPGRLEDLLNEGDLRLDDVERVVLDEADRMADMGFVPAVRRILDACASDRQTMLFSATLDGAVDDIRRRYQNDPVLCEVDDLASAPDLEHVVQSTTRDERIEATGRLVDQHGSTIVFCRTKRGADRLAKQLNTLGVSAAAIHGDRTQGQRQKALDAFGAKRVRALVATDVAARGIHVDDVGCVIHYDPPMDDATYVHRSGRTGRAGNTGVVVSLVLEPSERRSAEKLIAKLEAAKTGEPVLLDVAESRGSRGGRAKPERARRERPRRERPRGERAHDTSGNRPAPAPARPEAARTATARPERSRPERARQDKARTERVRPEAARPEVARPAAVRPGHAASGGRQRGEVKFYDARRGFGFLMHDGRELFFHHSHLQVRVVHPGDHVQFDLGTGRRGEEAQAVSTVA